MKLVVAVAGASGSIYIARFLKKLLELDGETHLIVSPTAIRIFNEEMETTIKNSKELVSHILTLYNVPSVKNNIHYKNFNDIGSDIASGSNIWNGMVILPCSMKTIASISIGLADNLIERCADVTLKERRRLIIVPRETPYNQIHLKNMLKLDKAGAIILPASPGFYNKPKSIDDLGDFIAGRVFNLLGVETGLLKAWEG